MAVRSRVLNFMPLYGIFALHSTSTFFFPRSTHGCLQHQHHWHWQPTAARTPHTQQCPRSHRALVSGRCRPGARRPGSGAAKSRALRLPQGDHQTGVQTATGCRLSACNGQRIRVTQHRHDRCDEHPRVPPGVCVCCAWHFCAGSKEQFKLVATPSVDS